MNGLQNPLPLPNPLLPYPLSSFPQSASSSASPESSSLSSPSSALNPSPPSAAASPRTLSEHSTRCPALGGLDTGTGPLPERPKLFGFVGIQTEFSSRDRLEASRSTWLPSDPEGLLRLEQATGLAFRFVIGRSKDAKKMAEIEVEIEKYKDFMLIDVYEEYLKLPYKT